MQVRARVQVRQAGSGAAGSRVCSMVVGGAVVKSARHGREGRRRQRSVTRRTIAAEAARWRIRQRACKMASAASAHDSGDAERVRRDIAALRVTRQRVRADATVRAHSATSANAMSCRDEAPLRHARRWGRWR